MARRVYLVTLGGILVLWTLFIFAGVLSINELRFDDVIHLQANARLALPWQAALTKIWTESQHNAYTPVTSSLWFGLRKLSVQVNSFLPLYAANVIFHCLASLAVFLFLFELFASPAAAFWGAMMFSLHPMHVEPVAWLTGMRDVLSGLNIAISLLLYIQWAKTHRKMKWALSVLFFLLAVLSKPNVAFVWLAFPLLVKPWRKIAEQKASFLAWALCLPILYVQSMANQSSTVWLVQKIPWASRILVAMDALTFYCAKILFPIQVAFDYGRTPARILARPEIFATIFLPVIGYFLFKKAGKKAIGWIFFASLFPALGLIPFMYQHISTVADRFAYVAILALSLVWTGWLTVDRKTWKYGAAAIVAVLFSFKTLSQVYLWGESDTLFRQIVFVNPKSWIAHDSLANLYARQKKVDEATKEFRLGIQGQDEMKKKPEMINLLGVYLINHGRYLEAVRTLEEAIQLRPAFARAHHNLGVAWLRLGAAERAQECFWEALTWNPRLSESREGLKEITRLSKDP